MATVTADTTATPAEVFAQLANGWRYAEWVVGAKRIRAVDDDWPAVGSRFHHAVGFGPVTFRDVSKVLEVEPDRRLVMEVRVWPGGRGKVTLELEPIPTGTRIVMDEVPIDGPAKAIEGPILDALTCVRNTESLRRLRRALDEYRLAREE